MDEQCDQQLYSRGRAHPEHIIGSDVGTESLYAEWKDAVPFKRTFRVVIESLVQNGIIRVRRLVLRRMTAPFLFHCT